MAEETSQSSETVYRQVAPAGLAAEVTADNPVAAETVPALGRFLTDKLAVSAALRERVATLSGVSVLDLTALMAGHPPFPLDTSHLQRIATALVETQTIAQTDELWNALGSDPDASAYLLPPGQVVQAMSGDV